jgi:hypothetical protein
MTRFVPAPRASFGQSNRRIIRHAVALRSTTDVAALWGALALVSRAGIRKSSRPD